MASRKRHGGYFCPTSRFKRLKEDDAATSLAHLVLSRARPAPPSLHVASMIYAFLDCTKQWTFEDASEAGFVRMLDLLATNEPQDLPKGFLKARLLYNIEIAARKGLKDVLDWWITKYLPGDHPDMLEEIFHILACEGHFNVIQWLHGSREPRVTRDWDHGLYVSHPEIIRWVRSHWPGVGMTVLLHEVAAQGDLKFIKWLRRMTNYSCELREDAIVAAAQAGHLDILQYFFVMKPKMNLPRVYEEAAERGHLSVAQWLLSEDPDFEEHIIDTPVENILVVKWLAEEHTWKDEDDKSSWLTETMYIAARFSNMELLQYVYERLGLGHYSIYVLGGAVVSGNIDVAKWLYTRRNEAETDDHDLVYLSVQSCQLEMLQWVQEHFPALPTSTESMDLAASTSLEMVKFLHENRSEGCTSAAMDNAATRGKLDIVQFLHENRIEGCTENSMNGAAAHGHLDVVKFLQSQRSEGNTVAAMNKAAKNGHLEVVKFLHGLQPDISVATALTHASCSGHLSVVQWLYEHQSDEVSLATPISKAVANGHQDVAAYLGLHCQPNIDDSDMTRALKRGRFPIVQWLLENAPMKDDFFFQLRLDHIFTGAISRWHERVQRYGAIV